MVQLSDIVSTGGKSMINLNLQALRKLHQLTQEEVAEKINVSRQAVAKWESGETTPDIMNCMALADLYDVTLDELVKHMDDYDGAMIAPKGKHFFGTVTMNDRGQIIIPKNAREIFHLASGDHLLLLGDEEQGLALVKADEFLERLSNMADMFSKKKKD